MNDLDEGMRRTVLCVAAAALLACASAPCAVAQQVRQYGNPTLTHLGEGVAIALPLLAGGVTLYKDDWTGTVQLAEDGILTVGTAYALKNIVHEERPDGSDDHSFPSGTVAVAASGSSFLWGRYGWEYGVPAFLLTQFVSYTRIQAKQHHWYDTLASSAIAAGYGYMVTTPLKRRYGIDTALSMSPAGPAIQLSYAF